MKIFVQVAVKCNLRSPSVMPICADCGVNFPLLEDGTTCKKCKMLEGKSLIEKEHIKVNITVFDTIAT
jgi:predicted amidophosphoribosyltransferase